MNKLCFLLLLLAALGGLPMIFSPSSAEGIRGHSALLYIPPTVMALQAAAPRNNPALSLMAFGLNFWGLTNGTSAFGFWPLTVAWRCRTACCSTRSFARSGPETGVSFCC